MARIILYSGKGGVGKTTMSAAAALALSERGYRTLVISFDLAHSLSDSFDLKRGLFDQNSGLPLIVAPRLDLQEINVQAELERHWGEVAKFLSVLFASTGVGSLVAEELAIFPGMEDIICLLYLNQYVKSNAYDVIVVDCPPTSESVRFVSMGTTLRWYMEKRFNVDRNFFKVARPITKLMSYGALPDDNYFSSIQALYEKVEGVDQILADPSITSVRLVTNAEKMVVKETQRAFLYFTMFGLTTDSIVVNRLFSSNDGFFAQWASTHAGHIREIEEYFSPVPVIKLPYFSNEIIGFEKLREVGRLLFGDSDPADLRAGPVPFTFGKTDEGYSLHVPLPGVTSADVDLT
jgi:arsenite/tail-anchored protein-transporting ATPase